MKISIAMVAGGLTSGGVENVLYNYFSHMDTESYNLVYISYDKPDGAVKDKFEKLGFHVYEVTKKKDNFFKSAKEVLAILKKEKVQIIHSHMTLMCFITSVLAGFCGVKVRIAHSHLALHTKGMKKIVYGFFKWATKISSNYYFACGKEAAGYLYGEKFANTKVYYMNNAIDLEEYQYDARKRKEIRGQLQIDENQILIGHVGRFSEQKNHKFLIEVFKEVIKLEQNAKLLLIGDGPLRGEVEEQIKKSNLEENVILLGSIGNVKDYYHGMDTFVLPSLYEGLAVVLVEAQANGVNILTSDQVTKEIMINDNYKMLSLEDDTKTWARNVVQSCKEQQGFYESRDERIEKRKEKMTDCFQNLGYDINEESRRLDDFYKSRTL